MESYRKKKQALSFLLSQREVRQRFETEARMRFFLFNQTWEEENTSYPDFQPELHHWTEKHKRSHHLNGRGELEDNLVEIILQAELPSMGTKIVGISGVDASGKSVLAASLRNFSERADLKTAVINLDNWQLSLKDQVLFRNQPWNFYEHHFDFESLFEKVLRPIRDRGAVNAQVKLARPWSNETYLCSVKYSDLDLIIVEGDFLFKSSHPDLFTVKIWLDIGFEESYRRAISRKQEGDRIDDITVDRVSYLYKSKFIPGQKIHLIRDCPHLFADIVIDNSNYDSPVLYD